MELTDAVFLTSAAYADPRRFAARQGLYRWQSPHHDLPALVIEAISDLTGLVVDVGCGNGTYVHRLRSARPDLDVLGVDLSLGMLKSIAPPVVVADGRRLPLPHASADATLALHMLYHLPDIGAGIAELKRILRPGGKAVIATNSATDKSELQALWQQAHQDADVPLTSRSLSFSARFTLEDAQETLPRYFSHTELLRLDSTITVPSSRPVMEYFHSYLPLPGHDERTTRRVIAALTDRVRAEVARAGSFRITCRGGLFVCS
ncbi:MULTISPECIES: class I SAM-dependent methyltransferase [unclassified Streptomyces]|uniref:class I SAM-dependent methyltransferase n=1 Tax=unclassified Streptomyces TaxID=2593676 RepID=UPI002365B00E|nr:MULTISPECIES: class I SAM-dependent methyltransferase [unclassified Streptomyces]MDF3139852.1 class I SAM-dependent methyltransferase [Streptomyces sp. T21Q-yed]WDF41910.1 class I SAM-dependent methyltransferase [Streptomyces sp. T12]